jgi:predicted transcriptional regulator
MNALNVEAEQINFKEYQKKKEESKMKKSEIDPLEEYFLMKSKEMGITFSSLRARYYLKSELSMKRKKARRTKYKIAALIIETVLEPTILTEIVYKTRMNFNLTHSYLKRLKEKGLILENEDWKTYIATEKGIEYLILFNELTKLYE